MNDLISREVAINSIMEEPSEARYPVFYAEKLKQLPPAQSEPDSEWIKKHYEDAILQRQESETDDCSACAFLQDCRENVGNRQYITPCSEESL